MGPKVEGWAEECFRGLQYTKLYIWLLAGGYIEPPSFNASGSYFLSEIADFYSFWVRRDFEKAIKKERIELGTYELGEGFYQGVLSNGDVSGRVKYGFPIKEFYGIDRSFY